MENECDQDVYFTGNMPYTLEQLGIRRRWDLDYAPVNISAFKEKTLDYLSHWTPPSLQGPRSKPPRFYRNDRRTRKQRDAQHTLACSARRRALHSLSRPICARVDNLRSSSLLVGHATRCCSSARSATAAFAIRNIIQHYLRLSEQSSVRRPRAASWDLPGQPQIGLIRRSSTSCCGRRSLCRTVLYANFIGTAPSCMQRAFGGCGHSALRERGTANWN